jgi:uncharacterized membrane protein YkvA (DUF1232 family)
MSDQYGKYLDTFPAWLRSLGTDAEHLAGLLGEKGLAAPAAQAVAGGLNYLFKSLDLIPDGIDDIGYLDDAFVLRVAARHAAEAGATDPVLARLGGEASLVQSFLADNYARLDRYVTGLRTGAARGRTVQEILASEKTLEDFLADVRNFAGAYSAPSFSRDPKSLIKLRAFFDAKLPK